MKTKMTTITLNIPVSEEGLKKLKDYGFDFETNISLFLRDIYFNIRKEEEKNEKK